MCAFCESMCAHVWVFVWLCKSPLSLSHATGRLVYVVIGKWEKADKPGCALNSLSLSLLLCHSLLSETITFSLRQRINGMWCVCVEREKLFVFLSKKTKMSISSKANTNSEVNIPTMNSPYFNLSLSHFLCTRHTAFKCGLPFNSKHLKNNFMLNIIESGF